MSDIKRKIKVLYVQEPAGGGSLISLYELLKALDPKEIEVVVICHFKSKYTQQLEQIGNCQVYYVSDNLESNNRRYLKQSTNRWLNVLFIQYNSLRKYFKEDKQVVRYFIDVFQYEKPDIIHNNNDIAVNRSSIRAGIKAGIPQVLYNHFLPSYKFNFVDRMIDLFLLRKIGYHIHLTKAIEEHNKKLFYSSLPNSTVIHSFVDRNIFKAGATDCSIKKEFGIKEGEIIIANIGRVTHWKGQHILIEALNLIKEKFTRFKVLIVGSYEKGVGSEEYLHYLQNLTCSYQLQENIIFTGNRTDIAKIINTSDVVVHTAVKREPQGIVILEALLCKKTVIASNAAGSAELIKKYGGILFEPGNAKQLAGILLKLFQEKNDVIETKYAFDYALLDTDFNSSIKARQFVDIYKSCLKKRES